MLMNEKKLAKSLVAVILVCLAGLGLAGCDTSQNAANNADRKTAARQLAGYQRNQPVPTFTWSQLRQNLIEIETAQAQTTQTTSFFFNQGVQDPVTSCPSIGFPIPSTYQLTNPESKVAQHDLTLPQIEANGVYTGDTTGTFVICVDAKGMPYANYWEGFVNTVTGPAKWNPESHQVELIGPPSFKFTKGK
jgi:hypothetical protein